MSNVVFELFAKLGLDSSEYEQGLEGAKNKATSIGGVISGGLKTVGKASAVMGAAIAGATVAAGTALVKGASDVAAYGDNIDKMSQKMGISAQAYQEWDAIMQHSGTSIEALKPSMKTLANAAEKGSDAFEKLGISQAEVASLSQEDLFAKVITGLQGMEEGTERTYLTSQLLGRGATELGALLNTSAEDTEAMRQKVHELGGVMSNDAVKAAAAYQDSLQDMQTGFAGLKRNLMAEFLPGITSVMDGITAILTQDYDGGLEKISDGINNVVSGVTSKLPQIVKLGSSIIKNLGQALIQNAPMIFQAGISLIMELGKAIIENLPMLIQVVIQLVQMIATSLVDSLPTLIPAIVEMITQIVQILTQPNTIAQLIQAVIQIFLAISMALIENLPLILKAIIDINIAILQALIQNAPLILDAILQVVQAILALIIDYGGQFFASAAEIIGNLANSVGEWMANVINNIATWLSQLPTTMAYYAGFAIASFLKFFIELPENLKIWLFAIRQKIIDFGTEVKNEAISIGKNFFNGIVDNIKNLPNRLKSLGSSLVAAVASLPSKFAEVGRNIVSGLWNGISSGWDWLKEQVSNLANSLLEGAKAALDIHSPSKKFMWIGRMVDEGFAKGLDDFSYLVTDVMDRLTNVENITPRVAFADGMTNAPVGGYNQTVNIYSPTALTPSEVARQTRNATRDMVLELRGKR